MGTTCHYDTTVSEMRKYYLAQFEMVRPDYTSTIVAHTAKWALQKLIFTDGRIECIPIWLNIYRKGNAVCEKLMDATVHPFVYDCPKKFIQMAKENPPKDNEGNVLKYFAEWLEKAEMQAPKAKPLKVEFNKNYIMTSGRKVYIVGEYNRACWLGYIEGVRYKIKKNTIKELAQ